MSAISAGELQTDKTWSKLSTLYQPKDGNVFAVWVLSVCNINAFLLPFSLSVNLSFSCLCISDCADTSYKRQNPNKTNVHQANWPVVSTAMNRKKCGLHQIFTPTMSGKMKKKLGNAWPFSININESSCWGKPDMRSGYSQDALQILLLSIFHYTHSMTQEWAQLHMFIFINAIKCFVHKCCAAVLWLKKNKKKQILIMYINDN